MPDEDADRHPATIRMSLRFLFVTIITFYVISTMYTAQTSRTISKIHTRRMIRSANRQRTDYGLDDHKSLINDFMINDTGVTNLGIPNSRRYPDVTQHISKTKRNKRKRKPEVQLEDEIPHLYNQDRRRQQSPSVSAALFLQASKDSMRGDKMLKSSKDALIVTKKSYLKKDWCKTEPLIQRVREVGCFTRTVVNRFCYGQCNSFYIPKNAVPSTGDDDESSDMDKTSFKSCAFCKPKRFRWITITLNCPGRKPPYKKKRIQRIKKCKCISEILQ